MHLVGYNYKNEVVLMWVITKCCNPEHERLCHVTVQSVLCLFRYDYENCDAESCAAMMNKLEQIVTSPVYVGTKIIHRNKSYVVKLADNFRYEDPVDGSITERQVGHPAPHYIHRFLEVDVRSVYLQTIPYLPKYKMTVHMR